jgi:uncharacterized protein YndB with AHSA1/START domain
MPHSPIQFRIFLRIAEKRDLNPAPLPLLCSPCTLYLEDNRATLIDDEPPNCFSPRWPIPRGKKGPSEESWTPEEPEESEELTMIHTETLKVTTPSDREIAMSRVFDAPCRLVFAAMTMPELVRQWLLGPDGWSMPVCEIDLRVGGKYRYLWKRVSDGREMGMGGVYKEVVAPERIVATEVFDDPWYPGEAVGTSTLIEHGGRTTLTQTMLYESKEIRDAILKTPMEKGVARSYDRMAELLASQQTREVQK